MNFSITLWFLAKPTTGKYISSKSGGFAVNIDVISPTTFTSPFSNISSGLPESPGNVDGCGPG